MSRLMHFYRWYDDGGMEGHLSGRLWKQLVAEKDLQIDGKREPMAMEKEI